ncbi:MAG: cytochrome c, partial [Chloroflexi bacterium]|nr:cytochrome c [Chloroflexota bacterium]
GLSGVGTTADTRVAGLNADEYLTQSIKSPNAFVVPDFFADLMPATFGQTLSEQEIADIVAYLISLP